MQSSIFTQFTGSRARGGRTSHSQPCQRKQHVCGWLSLATFLLSRPYFVLLYSRWVRNQVFCRLELPRDTQSMERRETLAIFQFKSHMVSLGPFYT